MPNVFRLMHDSRRSGQISRLFALLACLLIGIRVAAAMVCSTCFTDWEKEQSRAFYLHAGIDRDRCHHGLAPASPWIVWACSVNEDESAFVLPEIPSLPVVVSVFVPLVLVCVSWHSLPLITAHGRGPPAQVS
ncbi:MAG: hypothetical protein Q7U39_03910 [Nitrospira sp.]|nr:hypothetical protein [Nitrospira sp.]